MGPGPKSEKLAHFILVQITLCIKGYHRETLGPNSESGTTFALLPLSFDQSDPFLETEI